jgi:uncharacterized membrane protein YcaP (DUF421 family)
VQEADYAFDLSRILLGNRPWIFLAEIFLRTAVMYCYVLALVRLLGKRGMGQLAPFDFVIVIALGSATGDPMFYPDVPLLHAIVAITAIVLFTRGLVHLSQRFRRIKDYVSATTTRLVCDGVMDLAAMKREGIARSELFQALRTSGLEHLGQAERAYLEPTGRISIFEQPRDAVRAGIPLLPEEEESLLRLHQPGETILVGGSYGCWCCGLTESFSAGASFPDCPHCGKGPWTRAVTRIHDVLAQKAAGDVLG